MILFNKKLTWLEYVYVAWLSAIVATLGSLVYSDVIHVPICPLCWYQRIVMYPLVIIYAVGILTTDKKCTHYAMPLITIGFLIALYQVLLQAQIVPNLLLGCKIYGGVSCGDVTFKLFGLITIPQQALAGFFVIGLLNWLGLKDKY